LEHHDIASLEQLWKASEGHRSPPPRKASSSGSNTSQRTTTFTALKQENESNASQSDALAGIGGNLELLEDYPKFDTTLDIQSPSGIEEQRARIPAPARINLVAPNLAVLDPNPYSSYQNGQMVAIGVYRSGFFHCQHLDGLCQQFFDDAELLQLHFEIFHFAFTRIDPPTRYICSADACMNESTSGPCFNCGSHNTIEPWIYGHYMRSSSLHRHSPDAQPVQGFDALQPPFSSYSFPSPNAQWENDIGDFPDFNDSGDFTFQNGNAYDGTPYDYDASQGSDNGGQSPANMFGGARYSSRGYECASVTSIEKPQKLNLHLYLSLGIYLVLITLASLAFTHDWISSKARTAFIPAVDASQSRAPVVEFIGMLASFAICFSAKHINSKGTQSVRIHLLGAWFALSDPSSEEPVPLGDHISFQTIIYMPANDSTYPYPNWYLVMRISPGSHFLPSLPSLPPMTHDSRITFEFSSLHKNNASLYMTNLLYRRQKLACNIPRVGFNRRLI
jgi:hypothetical protein